MKWLVGNWVFEIILEQLDCFKGQKFMKGETQTQYLNLISNSQNWMGLWDLRMSILLGGRLH